MGIVGWLSSSGTSAAMAGAFGGDQQIIAAARNRVPSDSDNIRGSKLVTIVPPTLLKMNPNGTTTGENCIGAADTVFIPIRVKGVPPFEMTYERIDFDGNVYAHTATFGTAELEKSGEEMKKKRVVLNHLLELTEPGVYRATSVRELGGDGATGRVLPTLTLLVACPDIKLLIEDDLNSVDMCVGSREKVDIVAVGSPPFTATYSRRVGREAASELTIDMSSDSLDHSSISAG